MSPAHSRVYHSLETEKKEIKRSILLLMKKGGEACKSSRLLRLMRIKLKIMTSCWEGSEKSMLSHNMRREAKERVRVGQAASGEINVVVKSIPVFIGKRR